MKPLGIIELLTRVGEEHIRLQNLLESATNFQQRGKRGRHHTAITFLTNQITPSEVLHGNCRQVGLVLWLPAVLVEQAQADHAGESGVAEAR